jgi:hypothetical protein
MSEPRAFWCPCCPYKLPGLLSVPFKQRCPKCRRTIMAEQKNGTLTIRVEEDTGMVVD